MWPVVDPSELEVAARLILQGHKHLPHGWQSMLRAGTLCLPRPQYSTTVAPWWRDGESGLVCRSAAGSVLQGSSFAITCPKACGA
eukprot:3577144-Alexandrium_andersonii.AAC.1